MTTNKVKYEKHGMTGHPLYPIWLQMNNRCNKTYSIGYKWYGGRGIKVCERWFYSFSSFVKDIGERPEGHTLDRIDSTKDYSPENCRWAKWDAQGFNKNLKPGKSGYRGVAKIGERYRAHFSVKNKTRVIGYFETAQEAYQAYLRTTKEWFGFLPSSIEKDLING